MQITSTIKKLLSQYTPEQLLNHISNEIEQQSKHYLSVGAPIRADYGFRQVAIIREATQTLYKMPYLVKVPKS